jgi:endonuclease/exonuclease/phosphatase family metal-dependent hydrolase
VNTGKVLADALGLHHVHAPARAKPRPFEGEMADSTSGLSILSRVPLSQVRVIDLPSTPADGERIALTGRLTWTDTLLTVAVVHFTYLPGAASLRLRQTETLVEALPPDIDTIIGGDFNAEPGSSALSWLRELPERTVTDAWDVAGRPQPTLMDRETETLSAGCVDHVMLIRPAVGSRLTLSAARRVLDTADPVSGLRPSDHAGLLAKLRVA